MSQKNRQMISLSYSSLKLLNGEANHEWLNRQMGVPVPNYPFLKEGKENQRPIQLHLAGKKEHPFLKNINIRFPIVEEKDFDDRVRFGFVFNKICDKKLKDDYVITGFYDALEPNVRFGEIKLSSKPMSINEFQKSFQRKIYALSNEKFKEAILITGFRQIEKWEKDPPKVFSLPLTKKDREEAIEWILKGIRVLESGNFKGGLDKNGKCTGCFWNMSRYPELANCNFK